MKATVYRFWVFNAEKNINSLAPRAATESAIAKIKGTRLIRATAEEVEEERVDPDGFLID